MSVFFNVTFASCLFNTTGTVGSKRKRRVIVDVDDDDSDDDDALIMSTKSASALVDERFDSAANTGTL